MGLLKSPMLGLLCSKSCPGSIILKLYDGLRCLRSADLTVIGGFQSPMERECLEVLLKGNVSIAAVLTHAKARIPTAWRKPIQDGQLAVLAPQTLAARRVTSASAHRRNQMVVRLSDALFIPHASPRGNVFSLAADALDEGVPVLTLADANNQHLVQLGARPAEPEELSDIRRLIPLAD